MLIKVLGNVQSLYAPEAVVKESRIFWIHCNMTTSFLLGACAILGSNQLVGHPISCRVIGIPTAFANSYCWMMSTFSMPESFSRPSQNEYWPAHPGVSNDFGDDNKRKYHAYYQWVPLLLFLQALLCYAPKYIWNSWEDGRMKALISGVLVKIMRDEERADEKKKLVKYLLANVNDHNWYAATYLFCELLCLINITMQFYGMNVFFHGDFVQYGYNILFLDEIAPEQRVDEMVSLFPEVTKCSIYKFGGSGSLIKLDGYCFLRLNRYNQKIYIFLWCWFILVAIAVAFVIVIRITDLFCPALRQVRMVDLRSKEEQTFWRRKLKELSFGDRFIIEMLSSNMNKWMLSDVVCEFMSKLDMREYNTRNSV